MAQSNIGSGLPVYPSGLSDKDASLVAPLYSALDNLSQKISYLTGNTEYTPSELLGLDKLDGVRIGAYNRITVVAAENLPYGTLLNLFLSGGIIQAQRADSSVAGRQAHAVCDTGGGLGVGAIDRVLFMTGRTEGISGSVFGDTYFLGTAGSVTNVAPGGPAFKQIVGIGLAGAGFYLNIVPLG